MATSTALDLALTLACNGATCPIAIMAELRTTYGVTLDHAMYAARELVLAGVVKH